MNDWRDDLKHGSLWTHNTRRVQISSNTVTMDLCSIPVDVAVKIAELLRGVK